MATTIETVTYLTGTLRQLYPARPVYPHARRKHWALVLSAEVVTRATLGPNLDLHGHRTLVDFIQREVERARETREDYPTGAIQVDYDPARDVYRVLIEIGTLSPETLTNWSSDPYRSYWEKAWVAEPPPAKVRTRFEIIEDFAV